MYFPMFCQFLFDFFFDGDFLVMSNIRTEMVLKEKKKYSTAFRNKIWLMW